MKLPADPHVLPEVIRAMGTKMLTREEALQQGRLILVAEDGQANQDVIRAQLTLLGYCADIASDGRDAFQLWMSWPYALVICDLHMPQTDGYQLTAAIRDEEKTSGKGRTPIIALTANAMKGEFDRCEQAGMNDYLSKPVPLPILNAMLQKWLPHDRNETPVVPTGTAQATADPSAPPDQNASGLPVDVDVLKGYVGDDAEMVDRFLTQFRLWANKGAQDIAAAYATGDLAEIGWQAHQLKSSARSVGAIKLGALCEQLEKAGKNADAASVAEFMPTFQTAVAVVLAYLAR